MILKRLDYSLYEKKVFYNTDGNTIPYRILSPPENTVGKYPIFLFLHGAGERGDDNVQQLKHAAGTFLKKNVRRDFPCFVLAPQCPVNGFWSSVKFDRSSEVHPLDFDYSRPMTPSLLIAIALLKRNMSDKRVDPDRIYIAGLSMGGSGTYEAVFHEHKLFAAAIAVCGGADVQAYDSRVRGFPFWVFHGKNDTVVNVSNSREIVSKLSELDTEVRYTEYPELAHNSWDRAFSEPALLPWLFGKSRVGAKD